MEGRKLLWKKEQGGGEEKIADWPEPHGQPCLGGKAQSWLGTWGSSDWIYIAFLVKWSVDRDIKVINISVC